MIWTKDMCPSPSQCQLTSLWNLRDHLTQTKKCDSILGLSHCNHISILPEFNTHHMCDNTPQSSTSTQWHIRTLLLLSPYIKDFYVFSFFCVCDMTTCISYLLLPCIYTHTHTSAIIFFHSFVIEPGEAPICAPHFLKIKLTYPPPLSFVSALRFRITHPPFVPEASG